MDVGYSGIAHGMWARYEEPGAALTDGRRKGLATMKKLSIPLALFCVLVSGCRYEVADDDARVDVTEASILPSNEEVLAKAYDNSYQIPEGFYVDDRADNPLSYSLYHVKDQSVSYELCTDVYDEALAWEAADNENRAVNGTYVASVETDRYFEFVRELSYPDSVGNVTGSTSPGFARVFKCSYVNRDGADRNLRDGYAGTLNISPLSENVIKTYSEYMWQFAFFWPARKKVLESHSAETGDYYQNTLLLALVTNQGNNRCDLLQLVDWVFSVDKSNGQITKSLRPIYQMESQLVDGIPQECAN